MERLARAQPRAVPGAEPFALVQSGGRGIRIVAINACAAREGVQEGQPLADARAMLPALKTQVWQEQADHAALMALVRWCGRYGPQRQSVGRDGLWVDVSGVAHLFGGEAGLLKDLHARLERLGLTVRSAIADTHGAAFALARSRAVDQQSSRRRAAEHSLGKAGGGGASRHVASGGDIGRRHAAEGGLQSAGIFGAVISQPDATRAALHDLPVSTLRLSSHSTIVLRRLGLFRIGQLYGLPRTGLARRFCDASTSSGKAGAGSTGRGTKSKRGRRPKAKALAQGQAVAVADDVLLRLDQALGVVPEPLSPLVEPPVLRVCEAFGDPLLTTEGIQAESRRLADRVIVDLDDAGLGARSMTLSLYRTDGTCADVSIGMSAPCRDADHMMRLFNERLVSIDAGFGIDALALDVVEANDLDGKQKAFLAAGGGASDMAVTCLVDKLMNRLGGGCVTQLRPVESHIPERAQVHEPYACTHHPTRRPLSGALWNSVRASVSAAVDCNWPMPAHLLLQRPSFLLSAPEPVMVLAEVPEGAPRRFTWRRVVHDVAHATGPERLTPEWWHAFEKDGGARGSKVSRVDCGVENRFLNMRTRDYYRVFVESGASFWIFRVGTFGVEDSLPREDKEQSGMADRPRWFLHGLYG